MMRGGIRVLRFDFPSVESDVVQELSRTTEKAAYGLSFMGCKFEVTASGVNVVTLKGVILVRSKG